MLGNIYREPEKLTVYIWESQMKFWDWKVNKTLKWEKHVEMHNRIQRGWIKSAGNIKEMETRIKLGNQCLIRCPKRERKAKHYKQYLESNKWMSRLQNQRRTLVQIFKKTELLTG